MFQVLLVIALVCIVGSAWWGWLRYGLLGIMPALVSALILTIMYYDGRLYVR